MILNSTDLYMKKAKVVMKSLGIWVPLENEGILRKIYRVFTISLQYIFLLFQIIHIVQEWRDRDAVFQASNLLFTQACLCFKVTVVQVNMDMLKELLSLMASDIFQPQSETHEKILKHHASRIKMFLMSFMVGAQLTCCIWALKPLLDYSGTRKFPFEMWMPVNPEKSIQYVLGYVFQMGTIFMSACMYFAVDSVSLSPLIFGCAQMDIIKDKLLSIETVWDKKKAEIQNTLDKNYSILTECIKQHQAVLKLAELVENVCHSYLLFQLSGNVGLFCMSGLRLLAADWRSVLFFSTISYLIVMAAQLFLTCWCGHELTASSEDLHTVLYKCMWLEQSLKFKRALLIAMIRVKRPLVLKAGHYIPLQRHTFVSILRMSYSYFALLNQMS